MSKTRLLITGTSGFIGRTLCEELVARGYLVRAVLRDGSDLNTCGCEVVKIASIDSSADWTEALCEVTTVIHLAARVHVMHDDAKDPLKEFRLVNVAGTEQLARSAAAHGVKRLVYVSSIKVNGDATFGGKSFTETDAPSPQDPYAISKWEAEQVLHQVAQETGLEVVIVRPSLVYGPTVKGNFAQLLRVLDKRIPMPFAFVHNMRSLVYVGNLVDALIVCATHLAAAGQTYLLSDGEDISTPDLLRKLGVALGRPARLFPCPPSLLKLGGRLTGKSDQVERLLGSLQVDSGKIRRELNWTSPFTLKQGLNLTADWYRREHLR